MSISSINSDISLSSDSSIELEYSVEPGQKEFGCLEHHSTKKLSIFLEMDRLLIHYITFHPLVEIKQGRFIYSVEPEEHYYIFLDKKMITVNKNGDQSTRVLQWDEYFRLTKSVFSR